MLKPYLFVDRAGSKGRGVFTAKRIAAGKVVEISPVIVMSMDDRQYLDKTMLHDYIFEWGENKDKCCMALGLVPIYNHSYKSNCEYFMDYEAETIQVKSVRIIAKDEELTINYNGDWNNATRLWFDAE
ncbi:MAG: nuclear protein [Ferruginibacter sp.]|nr:nuclear protein [Ferruginibacter sp.]